MMYASVWQCLPATPMMAMGEISFAKKGWELRLAKIRGVVSGDFSGLR